MPVRQHRTGDPTPADYAALFEDDRRGVAILEQLIRRFNGGAVPDCEGIAGILKTYTKQGQRSVIDFVLTQINRHHNVEETTDENSLKTDG